MTDSRGRRRAAGDPARAHARARNRRHQGRAATRERRNHADNDVTRGQKDEAWPTQHMHRGRARGVEILGARRRGMPHESDASGRREHHGGSNDGARSPKCGGWRRTEGHIRISNPERTEYGLRHGAAPQKKPEGHGDDVTRSQYEGGVPSEPSRREADHGTTGTRQSNNK